jgi:uncharacterized protein GlcG (DUF336 family)
MPGLTLQRATVIADTALARGRQGGMLPLTVVVLDAGGHAVVLKREDGAGILRPDIALGKAWAALGMGQSTRTLRDRLADRPTFVNALAAASAGRFVPVPGGVLVRDETGEVMGAVGISGDTSDKDEYCAIEGVKAAGLRPDPDQPAPGWSESRL